LTENAGDKQQAKEKKMARTDHDIIEAYKRSEEERLAQSVSSSGSMDGLDDAERSGDLRRSTDDQRLHSRGLQLDVGGEEARALHRIVRAMHDGHCPKCGHLADARDFVVNYVLHTGHECPECKWFVSEDESEAALAAFRTYLQKSVEIFETWRHGNAINTGEGMETRTR